MSPCEPTECEFASTATSTEALVGAGVEKLRTLDRTPWRNDDDLFGMEHLTEEEEACLADPEKYRQELTERTPAGLTPTVVERFSWRIGGAKEAHNRYWARRLAFEGAGWPDALGKELLRTRVHELEHPKSDDEETTDFGTAEREVYRRAVGSHSF